MEGLLKQQFRPEFLNRLDEIVFYKPLVKTEITKIVDLLIKDLQNRLEEKQLFVKLTDRAKDALIEEGYDPSYGARPLKRLIQSKVETMIAKRIIASDLHPRSTITVDYDGTEYTTSVTEPQPLATV